jgi:hypothetical protein
MDYYCNQHIPMVKQKLGSALNNVAVAQGMSAATPGAAPIDLA